MYVCKLVPPRARLAARVFNAWRREGIFSRHWKVARVVLIKGNGGPELPSAYQSLCTLGTAEKVLETLIKIRLADAIYAAEDSFAKKCGCYYKGHVLKQPLERLLR